jgi:hypothetical protein
VAWSCSWPFFVLEPSAALSSTAVPASSLIRRSAVTRLTSSGEGSGALPAQRAGNRLRVPARPARPPAALAVRRLPRRRGERRHGLALGAPRRTRPLSADRPSGKARPASRRTENPTCPWTSVTWAPPISAAPPRARSCVPDTSGPTTRAWPPSLTPSSVPSVPRTACTGSDRALAELHKSRPSATGPVRASRWCSSGRDGPHRPAGLHQRGRRRLPARRLSTTWRNGHGRGLPAPRAGVDLPPHPPGTAVAHGSSVSDSSESLVAAP